MRTRGRQPVHRTRHPHGEPYEGVPAIGREFAVSGIVIDAFDGGKIVESWFSLDGLELAKQLGALG
ncbi:ester cyclase [Streptomyces sp. M10(2022)]